MLNCQKFTDELVNFPKTVIQEVELSLPFLCTVPYKCEHRKYTQISMICPQVLYLCMCMHCPHAYFKRSLYLVPALLARGNLCCLRNGTHRFASNWWLGNPSEHQKLKNKCTLSITTLLSGIVGKSGALTTFHFLLDLGNFNIAMFSSIVREPLLG